MPSERTIAIACASAFAAVAAGALLVSTTVRHLAHRRRNTPVVFNAFWWHYGVVVVSDGTVWTLYRQGPGDVTASDMLEIPGRFGNEQS